MKIFKELTKALDYAISIYDRDNGNIVNCQEK